MSLLEEPLTAEERARMLSEIGDDELRTHMSAWEGSLDAQARLIRKHFREQDCICVLEDLRAAINKSVALEKVLGVETELTHLAILGYAVLLAKVLEVPR